MSKGGKPAKPEILAFEDADKRFGGVLSTVFQGDYDKVLVIPGDFAVKGDLVKAAAKLAKGDFDIIAIGGNLTVEGRIRLMEDRPGLYVKGGTTAETLEAADSEVYINKGTFTYFVWGDYNHGILETGVVKTPWVINSDHDLRVTAGKQTKWIDNYGDDDDYDFGSENLATSFVKGVLGSEDESIAIDIEEFYKHLKAGKPVLSTGAKTAKEAALAEVASQRAKGTKQTELVLTTKKLKKFPADALKMPWLKKLVLDGNEIGDVPEGIGALTELEVLSLEDCDLGKLPEALGKLTKLRVLRIPGNKQWDFEGDQARCTPVVLPKSFGKLVALEELDVSYLSEEVRGDERPLPDMNVYQLPASIAKLRKLRVLRASLTTLSVPREAWALPIEELDMSGGFSYLKEFPPFITSCVKLRKLDLSGNPFASIPKLDALRELEELNLSSSLARVKKLPDLSKLPKLRVLDFNGNSTYGEPGHDVLAQLLAMKLPAITDLRIDRWGKSDDTGRKALPTEVLEGIGKWKTLEKIDLEYNDLKKLPDDFYELPALTEIKIDSNRLTNSEVAKIRKTWPKATIDLGDQD